MASSAETTATCDAGPHAASPPMWTLTHVPTLRTWILCHAHRLLRPYGNEWHRAADDVPDEWHLQEDPLQLCLPFDNADE
jgi:hypothetical protein